MLERGTDMEKQLQDQDIAADMLATQKATTAEFNMIALECTCPKLKKDVLSILNEEQGLQSNVFETMQQRGWYPTKPAQQQMVSEAIQKFEGMAQQLC